MDEGLLYQGGNKKLKNSEGLYRQGLDDGSRRQAAVDTT
jgi:hypothetical protein